ncbi:MAG: hypothetical protein ACIAS6_06635 [Phycisphaerales bacterium JB060]
MKKLMRTNRASRARTLASASGRAAGFTLVEMLVAVGAVAFVAVGIASIFASVGDTVSRGRSVSAITQYAAVLERQMREDFEAMTRDGYLIIRHEYADEGNPVPLYADQPLTEWRPRRIDELMFFIDEPTASAREPLVPGFVPEGSSARIYYGIGQRMEAIEDVSSSYARPDVTTVNRAPDTSSGHLPGSPTVGNDNRLASGWTLLRHSTALVSIGGGITDAPFSAGPYANPMIWRDNRLQVGLQPAAESIFRSINALDFSPCPILFPPVQTVRGQAGVSDPDLSPRFESGLVDVATTNLEEIRGIVQSSAGLAVAGGSPLQYAYVSPFQLLTDCSLYVGPSRVVGPVGVQQAWMLDGMPAPSHPVLIDFDPSDFVNPGVEPSYSRVNLGPDQIARMRYEPSPPDMHTPLSESVTNPTRGAIRLADQYALASSGFVPRVSEFIVEWSFGKTDDQGQMIWHGATRGINIDNQGPDEIVIHPYPRYHDPVRGVVSDLAGAFFVPYRLEQPAPAGGAGVGDTPREFTQVPQLGTEIWQSLAGDFADEGDLYGSYPVLPEVVHGVRTTGIGGSGTDAVVSYFGYTLPFFDADDPDNDGDPIDAAADETLDWPWPELVRVTVTLTDPGDETIERTFQFVFPTPDGSAR